MENRHGCRSSYHTAFVPEQRGSGKLDESMMIQPNLAPPTPEAIANPQPLRSLRWCGMPEAPGPGTERTLLVAACVAVAFHLAGHAALLADGSYFASEDDGYRTYLGFLILQGKDEIIGRFWPPGQFLGIAGLLSLGLDSALAPLALGGVAMGMTLFAVHSLARDLAPRGWGTAAAWGAVGVAAASPLELRLSHSALSEPFANAWLAIAAAALVRRHAGGSRALVGAGAVAMIVATWVRYEAWGFAVAYVVAAYVLARRNSPRRGAALEAIVAALALAGPLAWCAAQAMRFDDPLSFLRTVDEASSALAGPPSRLRVLELRFGGLACWAPGALVWASMAIALFQGQRSRLRPLLLLAAAGLPALLLQIASGKGLGIFVLHGHEVDFFSPRLVSNFEVGLFPLAGLGVAALTAGRSVAARAAALVLGLSTLVMLAAGVLRPMTYADPSSVRAGLLLRSGALDQEVGPGILLVERQAPRPPMGWASLGVLWGRWSRMIWATPQGEGWQLVPPTNVKNGRVFVPKEDLASWLDRRGVTAAWVLSPSAREGLRAAWPGARSTPIGEGVLLSR
jgi:hypothetical protein